MAQRRVAVQMENAVEAREVNKRRFPCHILQARHSTMRQDEMERGIRAMEMDIMERRRQGEEF